MAHRLLAGSGRLVNTGGKRAHALVRRRSGGAGAAGAVIGGLLGSEHGKNRKGNIIGYKQVTNCKDMINYSTETKEVYSHSVVTFYHEGRMYRVKFNK